MRPRVEDCLAAVSEAFHGNDIVNAVAAAAGGTPQSLIEVGGARALYFALRGTHYCSVLDSADAVDAVRRIVEACGNILRAGDPNAKPIPAFAALTSDRIPYPDASFDVAVGPAALAAEVHRVARFAVVLLDPSGARIQIKTDAPASPGRGLVIR